MRLANPNPNFWLIACHCLVLASALAVIVGLKLPLLATIPAIIVGTAPLILALKGLRENSAYTQLWLSIAMIFYIGAGLVETIAARATALGPVVLLLASVLELALLMLALKNGRQALRGSAES